MNCETAKMKRSARSDPPKRDVVVFAEAIQLAAGERCADLEGACGADEELHQQVEPLTIFTFTTSLEQRLEPLLTRGANPVPGYYPRRSGVSAGRVGC